jgi:aminoglycoside phosphotransferase (APT) family kinase protein
MDKAQISPAFVAGLVAAQFPVWAHLPVTAVELDGNDNTTFRLGKEYSVRLPSADAYVAQVEKEHRWLPYLAHQLPLPIPEPIAYGRPTDAFPRPWSIYRWRHGEIALAERVQDETLFARDLAAFLVALHAIGPNDGPAAGDHSFWRGGPLAALDASARRSIATLAHELDVELATAVWETALATEWRRPPVWVHGDITNSNLLVVEGQLSAVLDFGCSAVGDPACDLAIAWTFFAGESRQAFREVLAFDDATWVRGRAWALWKALLTRADLVGSGDGPVDDARRFGWRLSSSQVVDEVLANA